MIKRLILILASAAVLLTTINLQAQEVKTEKSLKATEVKNQANSGTCWSFATLSLMESELLRLGMGEWDLSEMFVVRMAYADKADRYVRLNGKANFSGGGQAHDVLDVMRKYGLMTEAAYSGLLAGQTRHDHMEMDGVLSDIMLSERPKNAAPDCYWRYSIDSVMDVYLGAEPSSFEVKGKTTAPEKFSADLGLKLEDYIEITSFSHHPYFTQFVLEVPDNWSAGSYYNVPLEDLMRIMTYAIDQGFTFAWDGDVSGEVGYAQNNGIAKNSDDLQTITQESRQLAFDNFTTTDDHLMHITGYGRDKNGTKYFLTKNSWGDNKGNKGYWWLSENYVRTNTIAIMLHKDAVPADLKGKLGL
jgi:bleomycin hydrolase